MTNSITLTVNQISLLRHTIGLIDIKNVKNRVYKAYRNYFCSNGKHFDFEYLCKLGVCVHGECVKQGRDVYVYYHLTSAGAKLLSNYLGITITI